MQPQPQSGGLPFILRYMAAAATPQTAREQKIIRQISKIPIFTHSLDHAVRAGAPHASHARRKPDETADLYLFLPHSAGSFSLPRLCSTIAAAAAAATTSHTNTVHHQLPTV